MAIFCCVIVNYFVVVLQCFLFTEVNIENKIINYFLSAIYEIIYFPLKFFNIKIYVYTKLIIIKWIT